MIEGGSVDFFGELWFAPYARGPVFFICPDREFKQLNADGYRYNDEFAKAIAEDTCKKVSNTHYHLNDQPAHNTDINGTTLSISQVDEREMSIGIYSIQGQLIGKFDNVKSEANKVTINLKSMISSKGFYILSYRIGDKTYYQKLHF